jgi:hypothetical protein
VVVSFDQPEMLQKKLAVEGREPVKHNFAKNASACAGV